MRFLWLTIAPEMGSGSSSHKYEVAAADGPATEEMLTKAQLQELAGETWTGVHDLRFEKLARDGMVRPRDKIPFRRALRR